MESLDSERQISQFERIHDDYSAHYYDIWSMRYREEFIFPLISAGADLNSMHVAELACGSGYNSLALHRRYPKILLSGFDISPSACADFARNLHRPAFQLDLTKPIPVDQKFDLAFVIGGLHHCVSDLDQTLLNVAKILIPGGTFVMLEPNSEFVLERLRKVWYRLDSSFDSKTEHALNHDDLLRSAGRYFSCTDLRYFGGPAYFGVLNSMVLRIPLKAKPMISPILFFLERYWNRIPGRRLHNVFLARWQRNEKPADL